MQSSHKRPRLSDINSGLTCILCNGYFIDATTISECLHSFCKSCIVKHLETDRSCPDPDCHTQVHSTKPFLSIRSDQILQDIVYKLIPDVFKNEMERRRVFYAEHPEGAPTSAEDRGEVVDHRMFYMPNDKISLSLEYGYGENQIPENGYQSSACTQTTEKSSETDTMKRYLLCPAGLSILHLKKFIVRKYGLPTTYKVDVMYLEDILNEDYTLMDVAYIYAWKRSDPMRLFYRISERPIKRLKTSLPQTIESKSGRGSDNSDITNSINNSLTLNQSKLVGSQAPSSCAPNKSTSTTIIMTGAAPVPMPSALKANNGSTGVTSGKGSIATPKHADTSKNTSALNTPQPTAATPQGILKSKSTHMSASAVQTDEPPKKLRKILPNNSSASTPRPNTKSANTTSAPSNAPFATTTSTSTVTTLRQCRINTDKIKQSTGALAPNLGYKTSANPGLSASKTSEKDNIKCVSNDSESGMVSNPRKSSSRKSSAFDVRTLIGTKSPTLQCNRHSEATTGSERKDEKAINHKNVSNDCKKSSIKSKQLKSSARESTRNRVTSTLSSTLSSMPSTQTSTTTSLSKKLETIETSRPPTNSTRSTAPNDTVITPVRSVNKTNASLQSSVFGIKSPKIGSNVSTKQLNTKTSKTQNQLSMKSCNESTDRISIKPISGSKFGPQALVDQPKCLSSPLSPTSIRIKLPPPPPQTTNNTNKSSSKLSSVDTKQTALTSTPVVSTHGYNREQKQSIEMFGTKQTDPQKSQLSDNKSTDRHKPIENTSNHSISKSSQNQSKTKGASINQIVSKIASGVTSKSTSVNVTSTTPTLPLTKTYTSAAQLISSSNEVTPNKLNDDKVSTTTSDSGVGSQHRNDSAIKAVSCASTNTGNLVIRISTNGRTHSVESLVSPKDKSPQKINKFDNKKDLSTGALNSSKPNVNVIETKSNKTSANEGIDKNAKNESQVKCVNSSNDEEDDEDDIDGRKLVVDVPNEDRDVPNEDSYDIEIMTNKANDAIKPSAYSAPKSRDISSKLAISISSTTLSANCAVLTSPPPTPTPSPKSESDSIDSKPNTSPSNGPLDLSMSTKKEKTSKPVPTPMRAIYDIPPPKPKHCANPVVLDKHRGLFNSSTTSKQPFPACKLMANQSQSMKRSTGSPLLSTSSSLTPNFDVSKNNRSIGSSIPSNNTTISTNHSSNSSRHRSVSHNNHSHSHHNQKNYSVITPDPHRYQPKIVIRNISSPPSMSSHFNYPTHH